MKSISKIKSTICVVMALAILFSLPFAKGVFAASNDGLNGDTCLKSDFNESVYDVITTFGTVTNNGFTWPSSGTVLVKGSGANWTVSDFSGITIPAGLVVDFYKYYKFAGDADQTYKLVAHFDTTDGKAYTIGSATTNVGNDSENTGNTGSSGGSTGSGTSTSGGELWGTVKRVYVRGTPSDSYSNYYDDVPSTMWCYHPIMTLTEGGLLNGYGNHKFGPNDSLTRAQVSIILNRLYNTTPSPEALADNAVSSRAFAAIRFTDGLIGQGQIKLTDYELSLVRNAGGLLAGLSSDGRTGTMYRKVYDNWRASLNAGENPEGYIASIDDLPDADAIHKWINENYALMRKVLIHDGMTDEQIIQRCEKCIALAYNLGMIHGVDGNHTFDPYGNLTRGQMAQILYNVGWTYEGCCSYKGY